MGIMIIVIILTIMIYENCDASKSHSCSSLTSRVHNGLLLTCNVTQHEVTGLTYTKYTYSYYHIRTNIGEELNLANWRITMQLPNLNLANIFNTVSLVTLVTFDVDIGLTSHSFHNKSLTFVTQYNRLLKLSAPAYSASNTFKPCTCSGIYQCKAPLPHILRVGDSGGIDYSVWDLSLYILQLTNMQSLLSF